jgi:NADH-quinone oxidoreductase subunit G
MKKVKIKIDDIEIEVEEGTTVLEAIKKLNKVVPTFCYHPKLPIFGGCRMCLVYDKKWKNPIIACGTYVYDGMEIETENEEIKKDRSFILEMLFTRHPLDCPICDKAGECDLQNWGTYYGPQKNITPLTPYEKIRPEEDWESDYFEYISNRCILCLRCVSVCENVVFAKTLGQKERGFEIVISPDNKPMDEKSSCEFCGLCVDICPVGAIIFKPFKYNTRAWLLKEDITHCGLCSMNCPIAVDHDGKKVYRIRSTSDLEVCLGAYLGYDIIENDRLEGVFISNAPSDLKDAIKKIAKIIERYPYETAIITSQYSTNEVYKLINEINKKSAVYVGSIASITLGEAIKGFEYITNEKYEFPTEKDILEAEKIVILGEDIANVNPVISYYFHKVYYEGKECGKNKEIVYIGYNADRIKKFFPKIIELSRYNFINTDWENDIDIDDKTLFVYSTATFKGHNSFKIGEKLGELYKKYNAKVLILPYSRNPIGAINHIERGEDLRAILEAVAEGKIKHLIVFGEDLLHHFQADYLSAILSNLKNLILITPFKNGLEKEANIVIGSSLWIEEEGTVDSWRGKVFCKKVINGGIEEKVILQNLLNEIKNIDEREYKPLNIKPKDEGYIYKNIRLEDFSYFSKRSKNLQKIKQKRK